MPRNAQGVYVLPAGNPVVTGTTITSTWANGTMPDLGSEITASLPRDGSAGMTGPLILARVAEVPFEAVTLQQFDGLTETVQELTDETRGYRDEAELSADRATESEVNAYNSAQSASNCYQATVDASGEAFDDAERAEHYAERAEYYANQTDYTVIFDFVNLMRGGW